MRRAEWWRCAAGCGLIALLAPNSSAASGFLLFSETRAVPGQRVIARTAGDASFGVGTRRSAYPVYFVPKNAVSGVASPTDTRLVRIGALRVDKDGNATLAFEVPNISPGEYVTVVHCKPCQRYSGSALVPFGPFNTPFLIERDDSLIEMRVWFQRLLLVVVGGVLGASAVIVGRRMRGPSQLPRNTQRDVQPTSGTKH